jgi:hypothetical protein
MTVLSIDPGRSAKPSIGWCLFEKDGTEIARGEMDWKGLVQSFGYLVYYLGGDLTSTATRTSSREGFALPWG